MDPAIRKGQVVALPVDGLVYTEPIADDDSGIIFQEFNRAVGITPFLILVEDD